MTEASATNSTQDKAAFDDDARRRVEELIEEEEGIHNRYVGVLAAFVPR